MKNSLKNAGAKSADKTGAPLVAYFCMEYGLSSDFLIYSGGLGILAGDLIKAAYDVKYPMVAIGILWRQGYTSQTIDANGQPADRYYEYRYPFLKDTGVEVTVNIKKETVRCKVWLCDCFGNIPLYLLDTFLPDNPNFLITGQLYGWFDEERMAQEIILGVGGVKALKALGIQPDVYHFNEGHAVLAGLELIKNEIIEANKSFKYSTEDFTAAWEKVRNKIVFTTHTPVIAGNESHSLRTMRYIGADNGFKNSELVMLGGNPFNMTVAGLRLSKAANAVSELHAVTAGKMWANIDGICNIVAVTNGVHNGTWQNSGIADANTKGADQLWDIHMQLKKKLIGEIKRRNNITLDPESLIIGFARRAAPYKRSDLIFSNPDKIIPLLESGKICLVFAGKAHPNDLKGKSIIANLYKMSQKYPDSIIFIQNYSIEIGQLMTQGCDVWLNNPVRPLEASGTSGMKAAMNGVLNLSVLDGWWPEGCEHGLNGWQIGGGYEGEDCDEHDSLSLYKVLTEEVIPTFYENRQKWVSMMRSSIQMSQFKFSAARMLDDYVKLIYRHTNK